MKYIIIWIFNKTIIYEYCYLENNMYYIDIDYKINGETIVKKFFIEDYIKNIKEDGFYGEGL